MTKRTTPHTVRFAAKIDTQMTVTKTTGLNFQLQMLLKNSQSEAARSPPLAEGGQYETNLGLQLSQGS